MTPDAPFQGTLSGWLAAAALVSLSAWVGTCWLRRSLATKAAAVLLPLHAIRAGLAFAFWSSLLRFVVAAVETVGSWPQWFLALSAAVASELVLHFYSVCPKDAPRREKLIRMALPPVRVALIGLLAVLLMEPIISHQEEHESERVVAILLDESDSMTLSSRSASDGGMTRREVAERLLSGGEGAGKGLLDRLAGDYQVRLYQFGTTARPIDPTQWRKQLRTGPRPDEGSERWSASTDFANALRQIDGDLPTEALSGVILLTDGCDHSATDPRQAAHRLIQNRVPISSVVIGSQTPVRDAEVVTVQSPPQVFLGDSVALRAALKIDQCQGQTAKVALLKDGQPVEEKAIPVTSNRHRDTVLFRHQPTDVGVHKYTVRIEPLADEANLANNSTDQFVTVSNDHIRLLVIDDRPRWEFRYLRNLFAGRDRTVYLQSVLLQPDRLAGVPAPPVMPASALRAFDDCEATALPAKPEDWLKFDVIVLGDVAPERLGAAGLAALETFVKNRGGSLIVIAGQNHMPHAYARTPLADLLPVRLDRALASAATSPDESFFFAPSRDTQSHIVMQQVGAGMDSLALAFPSLSWRHPACEAKAGATVLGYAAQEKPGSLDKPKTDSTPTTEQQRRNALMLWQRFGAGKVLHMTFDQSWRLRFGVGDKYHHQFWGQIVRWAVKERLSVGTDLVRMGTDRVRYPAGDTITVRARLVDAQRDPVNAGDAQVLVYDGDRVVQQVPLVAQVNSGGLLQAEIRDLKTAGKYRVELAGAAIGQLLASEKKSQQKVATDVVVEATSEATEAADVVADATLPTQLADATGGKVVTPENVEELLKALGPKSTFRRERWTVPLWNGWPVMLVFLTCVSLEWTLRRSRGLV